jgi:peptidoglycan hydrolase-like protein with peptidoglycan-binding domain
MSRSECEGDIYISRGAKHAAVRDVQAALNKERLGQPLAVDGDFGRYTEAAVLKLQLREPSLNLVVAGVVGPKELDYLTLTHKLKLQLGSLRHVGDNNWKIGLSTSRMNLGGMVIDPRTGAPAIAIGEGFVLKGYEALKGGRINCPNSVWTFHGPGDPDRNFISNNECALLVQGISKFVGGTGTWRRGPQVRALAARKAALPIGTVIATLRDGYYNNDHSGRSHVGIFQGWTYKGGVINGFKLFEQSNGSNIGVSTKLFVDKYDRDELTKRKNPSPHGDYTIPVYDPKTGAFLGVTTIIDDLYRKYRYNLISIGDEYYVVYSNGKQAVERL